MRDPPPWSSNESASRIDPSEGPHDQRQRIGRRPPRLPCPQCRRGRPASPRARSAGGRTAGSASSTVTGTLRISVVAKMNFTCGGGSSSVFRSALNAPVREHVHLVDDVDLVAGTRRRGRRPVDDLADVVDAGVRGGVHLQHVDVPPLGDGRGSVAAPQGSIVGPPVPSGPTQFSPLAMIRAVVVLPTPRTPVSMKACAIRSAAKALRSVRTIASCPTRSAKVAGRYLRASTRYSLSLKAPFRWWMSMPQPKQPLRRGQAARWQSPESRGGKKCRPRARAAQLSGKR